MTDVSISRKPAYGKLLCFREENLLRVLAFFVVSVNFQCFIEVVDGRDSVVVEVNALYTPLPTTDVLSPLLHMFHSHSHKSKPLTQDVYFL